MVSGAHESLHPSTKQYSMAGGSGAGSVGYIRERPGLKSGTLKVCLQAINRHTRD